MLEVVGCPSCRLLLQSGVCTRTLSTFADHHIQNCKCLSPSEKCSRGSELLQDRPPFPACAHPKNDSCYCTFLQTCISRKIEYLVLSYGDRGLLIPQKLFLFIWTDTCPKEFAIRFQQLLLQCKTFQSVGELWNGKSLRQGKQTIFMPSNPS